MVAVAADSRIMGSGAPLTDAGVKTYELGGRAALVASGNALPPLMAAEITRSIIDNHNRRTPDRLINFADTVRVFSFLMKRTAAEWGADCHVAVAGFRESGAPCLASVRVSPL